MIECPCPVCGFYTTGEHLYGSYSLCSICGWEDDHIQLANPASSGGANNKSFIEYQVKTLREYPIYINEYKGYLRDIKWRPMRPYEIEKASIESSDSHWMHKGVEEYSQSYWVSRPIPNDIEADIDIIPTRQGGRSNPIASGYRSQFHYCGKDWVVSIQFEHVSEIPPGSTGSVFIGFMSPLEHIDKVKDGLKFELREGARKIATGQVSRIVDLLFSANLYGLKTNKNVN